MAWTDPKTMAVGDDLIASDWNTYVRDNLKYLHGDTGDTLLAGTVTLPNAVAFRGRNAGGTGNVNIARINAADGIEFPLGAANAIRVLLNDGVTVKWSYDYAGNPTWFVPQVLVHNSADLSVAAADGNKLMLWDTEDFDNATMHSTGANTEQLIAPIAGKYLVNIHGRWENDGTPPVRLLYVKLNNSDILLKGEETIGGVETFNLTALVNLAATNYVNGVFSTDDVAKIQALARYSCYFGLTWIGSL